MKLADFASPLAAKNHFLKASFGGFAGSGKTRTASEFIVGAYKDLGYTKPLLFIDNEKGARFLEPFFLKHGIKVYTKETTSLADVLEGFNILKAGEISFLFIDSLTKVYVQYIRDYKAKNNTKFMQLQDWGKVLPEWQERFSDRFVDAEGSVIFTGRGGFQYEKEEDVKDDVTGKVKKGSYVKSGVKMKLAGETPFEPDLNVWMEQEQEMGKDGLKQWRTAQVLKDRSATIDGKVFIDPSYKDFKPFVDFLIGVPTGKVSGQSSTENLAPSEDFGGYQRKQAREIEVEKIKAVFDRLALGSSGADKKLKVLIMQKCIGSTSATEVERMDAETLWVKRENLEKVARQLEKAAIDRDHWTELFIQCGDEWIAEPAGGDFVFANEKLTDQLTESVEKSNGKKSQ